MGTLPRCLCLILTLWMVTSRPSAAIRAGSPDSSPWWKAKEASSILQSARQFREAGNFAAAERLYRSSYDRAKGRGNNQAAIAYLSGAASCQMAQFHYRAALESYLQAKQLALSLGDRMNLEAVSINLASLYQQVGDADSALRQAKEAYALAGAAPRDNYKALLALMLGRLRQSPDGGEAEAWFQEGIEAARAQGSVSQEARAWDLLGEQRLQRGQWADAERALDEAFRLRVLLDPAERGFSYGELGALRLAQGKLDQAAMFTGRALARGAPLGTSWPEQRLLHQRGQIRLARGNIAGALDDFGAAVDLTARWRLEVLPAASSLEGANEFLEKSIFDSFIETGAAEALRKPASRWAAETFQAQELNRSASLRESLALAPAWRKKLAPEFWEVLGELRSEEGKLLRISAHDSQRAGLLRLKLTEMEAESGLGSPAPENKGENFRTQNSLIHFQDGLSESELVLSFHLGERGSYLWAVSREALSLYRLPPAARLRNEVAGFSDAVRTGRAEAVPLGERLYAELFGDLKRQEARKQTWLLSLEDSLFALPFAALVTERRDGKVSYLVEQHSLQIVPGALSLSRGSTGQGNSGGNSEAWFLGVGDPIYNAADSRWRPANTGLFARAGAEDGAGQLSRLVGSGNEIESSAQSWSAGSGTVVLIRGAEARRDNFLRLLADRPSVIHLATHVLTPPGSRDEAFIAFGLGSSAEPELLPTSDVAMLRVPGALVVMTGCDTGTGETRAGTGLLGLTRAWQMAGASAVLATGWAVKDSNGEIFSSFYRNLRDAAPAEALRRSQMEMIRSNTWRAAPDYWASYQVTGGAR
jgi:CHAT domain-containing protein